MRADIDVKWHSYEHPTYPQRFHGFEPYMSIIDLLFNVGAKEAKKILQKGGIIKAANPIENMVFPETIIT